MDLVELFFTSLGAAVVVYYGVRLLLFSRMLFPKLWFSLSKSFFTSMGEWAVVTGSSEGIGRAYAFMLAKQGMNVVIISRTKEKLDLVAKEIGHTTGQMVKVIVTDFIKENVFSDIEDQLRGLNIGVLVNNVGILPSTIPCQFLEHEELSQTITKVINCNVKTMVKMCKIILPDMENSVLPTAEGGQYATRLEKQTWILAQSCALVDWTGGKGLILNISSGVASVPFPMYTLYSSSKVFVERFSQSLQAEYKDKGIIIQAVAPFGVSTRMSGYHKPDMVTLSPEQFVERSLQYIRAGDKTNGCICHIILSWVLQTIPLMDFMLQGLQEYVKKKLAKENNLENDRNKSV